MDRGLSPPDRDFIGDDPLNAATARLMPAIAVLLAGFAASPWIRATLRYGAIVLAVLLFLLSLRRSGERTGRLAERLGTSEKTNDVQRRMLDAAARRPRNRNELADRLRDGKF